jgi:hypothetical protein
MPDFTPLPAQFVSRRGKARRPPRPLDNGKGEKLGSRKNSGITRIQPGVQRQIGKGRRRNRQNLVIRQSTPDFRDRRRTSRQNRSSRDPHTVRAFRSFGNRINTRHRSKMAKKVAMAQSR